MTTKKTLKKKEPVWKMIPYIDATDFPSEVLNWCEEKEISTHYRSDVAVVKDDGNPMAEWLKKLGVPKVKNSEDRWYDWVVAIAAT